MNDIRKQLKKIQVSSLTQQEKNFVWKQVSLNMQATPRKDSYKTKAASILKKSVAISLIFGMTMGTASATDNAKPGELLFPFDRAMENAQLSLSSGEKKDELKVKFALERVDEVKTIFSEVSTKSAKEKQKEVPVIKTEKTKIAEQQIKNSVEKITIMEKTSSVSSSSRTELENKVFEKLESKLSQEELTTEKSPEVEGGMKISDTDKEKIEVALGTALDFLGDVKGELSEQGNDKAVSSIDGLVKDLNTEIETLPPNITFEVKLSPTKPKVQFEVTSEDNKESVKIAEAPTEEKAEIKDTTKTETDKPKEEAKLEIKDGVLKINPKTEEKVESSKTEEEKQTSSTTTESVVKDTKKEEI